MNHKLQSESEGLWFLWNVCKFIKNKKIRNHIYKIIHSFCLILCWCTFGSNYSLKSFLICYHKLQTLSLRAYRDHCKNKVLGWASGEHKSKQSSTLNNYVVVWHDHDLTVKSSRLTTMAKGIPISSFADTTHPPRGMTPWEKKLICCLDRVWFPASKHTLK